MTECTEEPAGAPRLRKIVSGGQTGVDRAAWDCADELGIEIGGWVPAGRWSEDGPIAARYRGLRETASSDPAERTELNVRDSDATLIVSAGPLEGGTLWTRQCTARWQKPYLVLDLEALDFERTRRWLDEHEVAVLNVAGPRESERPGIGERARDALTKLFGVPPTGAAS